MDEDFFDIEDFSFAAGELPGEEVKKYLD